MRLPLDSPKVVDCSVARGLGQGQEGVVFASAAQLLPGYRLDLANAPRVVALRRDERAVARFDRNVDPGEGRRGAEKARGAGVLLALLWTLRVGPW